MQESAACEAPQPRGREAEPFTDRDRQHRDAPRVLLGRGVLRLEADHQRPHARAEICLLGCDEVRADADAVEMQPQGLAELKAFLDAFWSERLGALQQDAEREERKDASND